MAERVPDDCGHVEADGQRIFWERFGTGERETICLLNGLAMHTKAWYGFVPMLTDEFDVLLWDYLGQGESSAEDVPYEMPRFCDDLSAILDRLSLQRVHLMGISYGGFVGLDFYSEMAGRFERFVQLHKDEINVEGKLRPGIDPASAVMLAFRTFLQYYAVELVFGVPNHYGKGTEEVVTEVMGCSERTRDATRPAIYPKIPRTCNPGGGDHLHW